MHNKKTKQTKKKKEKNTEVTDLWADGLMD